MTDQGKTRRHAYSAVLLQTPTFVFFTHLSELIQGEADSWKTLKAAPNIQQQQRDRRSAVKVLMDSSLVATLKNQDQAGGQ